MSESEYSKLFDSVAKECDIENLSEHTLGALFWDHQQEKIEKLQAENERLEAIFEAVRSLDQFSAPEAIQAICEKFQIARIKYEELKEVEE